MDILLLYTDISTLTGEAIKHHYESMPSIIKQQLDEFTNRPAMWPSLCGKVLLRRIFEEIAPQQSLADIRYTELGKPVVDNNCSFNISHTGHLVMCAGMQGGLIGVDVEETHAVDINLYREYFTNEEWNTIASSESPIHVLYRMWVRKEAVLKAAGVGVLYPLMRLNVSLNELQYLEHKYHLHDLMIKAGYAAAIATDIPVENIKMKEIDLSIY